MVRETCTGEIKTTLYFQRGGFYGAQASSGIRDCFDRQA